MASIDMLMQVIAGARDTVITKQVVPERGLLEQVTAVCSVITTVALTVFSIVAVPAAWRFRSTYKKVDHLLERIYGDINPIMRHVNEISDNVNYVTTAIRADVQMVNATIASANERVQQAVAQTEQRLVEFNALLGVVQEEAERTFVSAASTVRGVRTGAAAFRDGAGMDFASDGLDPADLADEIESQIESEEEDDGYDGDAESAPETLSAAPRVRPRVRGQRRRGI
jgi:uncharacterized protein YoxC